MKNSTLRAILHVASVSAIAILLQACLDEGGGDSPDYSSPGGSDVAALSSIIGYQMVQTVSQSGSDPGITVVQLGDTITYKFIDSTTIQGEGLNTYPTTSWSYTTSGSVGAARLNYTNGYSEEELTFTSSSGGTYYSYNQLNSVGIGVPLPSLALAVAVAPARPMTPAKSRYTPPTAPAVAPSRFRLMAAVLGR